MFRICLVAIAVVILGILMKECKSEYSLLISIAACVLLFCFGLTQLEMILEAIDKINSYISVSGKYMGILIKILGITYIAEFTANLCRDAGYGAIATQVELVGKLTVMVISLPVLLALLETVNGLLQ